MGLKVCVLFFCVEAGTKFYPLVLLNLAISVEVGREIAVSLNDSFGILLLEYLQQAGQ